MNRLLPLLVVLLCAGCAALSTTTIDDVARNGDPARGIDYALPYGLVSIAASVVPATAVFTLSISEPKFVADPNHRYLLQYHPLPNYEDKITVTMHPGSPFFQKITADTTDKTADAIVALLGKQQVATQAALENNAIPIATQTVDLAQPEQVARAAEALSEAVIGFARDQSECPAAAPTPAPAPQPAPAPGSTPPDGKSGTAVPAPKVATQAAAKAAGKGNPPATGNPADHAAPNPAATPDKADVSTPAPTHANVDSPGLVSSQPQSGLPVCKVYQDIVTRGEAWLAGDPQSEPIVSLKVRLPHPIPAAGPADCGEGICYRPKEPYLVGYAIDGVVNSAIIYLPNRATLVSLDIHRAFFVNKVQTIEFADDGSLSKLSITKDSELLAISKLPLDVVDAITDALKLRVRTLQNQTKSATAKADLIKANAQLAAAQKAAANQGNQVAGTAKSVPPAVASSSSVIGSVPAPE